MPPVIHFWANLVSKMKSAQNFMKFGTVVRSSVLNTDISIEILDIFTCYIFGWICFQKLKMLKNLDKTQCKCAKMYSVMSIETFKQNS